MGFKGVEVVFHTPPSCVMLYDMTLHGIVTGKGWRLELRNSTLLASWRDSGHVFIVLFIYIDGDART